MHILRLITIAILALATTARAEPVADTWDLSRIYPDIAAWEADARRVEELGEKVAACAGHLGDSACRLRQCLDDYYEARRLLDRVSSYASMKYDENTKVPESQELDQRAGLLSTALAERTSFLAPEVLAIGKARIDGFLRQEPGLRRYRHNLDDILRLAPHTLGQEAEGVIASAGLVTSAPSDLYGILANADLPWPTIELSDGTRVRLDQSGYTRLRGDGDRALRKRVFETFWGKWREYERTFGLALYSQIKRDIFYARVRRYPSALAAALGRNKVPEQVYRTLLEQTNANLDTLHRYFRLRARMLGLDRIRYYDIYPPLVQGQPRVSIEDAKAHVLEAVKPLGPGYVEVMRKGFGDRWMDVYPRPGKRSGAYMNGGIYDLHPFVLMNFNDDYESLSTLAHEWGHALHSYLANRAQPYNLADYPIFLAEIASTFNEELLLEHMLDQARDDQERLFYLGSALEQLRGTFFRQAMFAEFELGIHEAVEAGQSLSGKRLDELYLDILRRYHGHDQGVAEIDDLYAVEWAYIPHFYYNFYVYQYATSIAASSLLARRVLDGEPGARERYLGVLEAGGSDYPYEILRKAGVDLASPEPYQALVARMNRIMDAIEEILARGGGKPPAS